jgi:hypothetical protein
MKDKGFDVKRFLKTKFETRTEAIPVPDMKDFFPEGEEAVWIVRGLTGQELGRANEAAANHDKVAQAAIDALTKGSEKEIKEAFASALGTGNDTPADIRQRREYLIAGSVNPTCNRELAVRLCEVYPIEFYQLSTAVLRLTGKGQEQKKSKPSGETAESGAASPSVTSGGASSSK